MKIVTLTVAPDELPRFAGKVAPSCAGGVADAALSPALGDGSVGGAVGVPLRAMCLSALPVVAAKQVLAVRDGFKMLWANARAGAAQVVELQPAGDCAVRHFVRNAVGGASLSEMEQAVSVFVYGGLPQPAGGGLVYMPPESFFWRTCRKLAAGVAMAVTHNRIIPVGVK